MQLTANAMDHRQKTRQGIAKARGNGVPWGSNGAALAKQNKDAAQAFAETLRRLIIELMAHNKIKGPVTLARALNDRGVKSRNGGNWHPNSVLRVLERLKPSLDDEVKEARKQIFDSKNGLGAMDKEPLALKCKSHGTG